MEKEKGGKRERVKEVMESYKYLLDRHFKMVPATWNVLLEVLLKQGKKKEGLALFDSTLDNHTPPTFQAVNSETLKIMVNECFKPGKFEEVIQRLLKWMLQQVIIIISLLGFMRMRC